ncbi:MAG TPA: DUF4153 domain-containing protein [Tabrizicola sp.]|nr:DUF4153 domain-containing protein [Tabrizicola sp.]
MQDQNAARLQLSLTTAFGAGLLWAVIDAADKGQIGGYTALVLTAFVLTVFGAVLAMAGPLGLWRALRRALVLGPLAAGLVWMTEHRFAEADQFFRTPLPSLAGFAVATLPVPFLVAAGKNRWNDYPTLFLEAWSIALRLVAAAAFTGLVWLVIILSDGLLQIVGIDTISRLIDKDVVVMVFSGAALGLGMAVIHDITDVVSPVALLRLFRLFLPVVLVVMAIFLVALPFRGLDGLTGGLSPAMLMLVMVGAGITLVSIIADQSDADAMRNSVLIRSAQGMALILPLFAGLALWAIWLRVGQLGWTPGRVFVALLGGLGLGYGLVYAQAVLRGTGWMERIRQGNIRMVLVVLALAALWLTPILNAERISAKNQLARFLDGRTPLDRLDPDALSDWGKPGAEALAVLAALAKQPGQEALAARLAGEVASPAPDRAKLAAELAALMPVQPASATGVRDTILPALEDYQLQDWLQICGRETPPGERPCLMVVADLMPAIPGEEALVVLQRDADYAEIVGIYIDARGFAQYRTATHPDGRPIEPVEAIRLLEAWRLAPPPVTSAQLNQLGTGAEGLMILP